MPTLPIIDIQSDYFPGGGFPLVEPKRAALADEYATVASSAELLG